MGLSFSSISCDYCGDQVDERTSIVKVHSLDKLNGIYLCHRCLFDIKRRHQDIVKYNIHD
jgi:hypothetical protein